METLLRTPLFERHQALGARLVPFAGWEMPVQYEGVISEHKAVRSDAGAFDVSHMGEFMVEGPSAEAWLQELLSNDVTAVPVGGAQYTLLTNESGGVIDDLIVYRVAPEQYLLVVNAANRAADWEWFSAHTQGALELVDRSDDFGLIAVQGPRALERLGLAATAAFTHEEAEIGGVPCRVLRTGYTGEEGVELLCAAEEAGRLWDHVLGTGVVPCGLGARDTLRLEVCYPLHGNEISPERDPISAGLGCVCALDTEFTGVREIRRIKEEGSRERLVAFVMDDPGVPRQGMAIEGGGGVTSGTHSPMLERGIGMGYVPAESATAGTDVIIDLRGRPRRGHVVKKPIYTKERD